MDESGFLYGLIYVCPKDVVTDRKVVKHCVCVCKQAFNQYYFYNTKLLFFIL